jgi:hypothetical protein
MLTEIISIYSRNLPDSPWTSRFVRIQNNSVPVYAEIADRSEIVKIGISSVRVFKILLNYTQLLILHFEFYLVGPEFMDEPLHILHGDVEQPFGLGYQLFFSADSQLIRVGEFCVRVMLFYVTLLSAMLNL